MFVTLYRYPVPAGSRDAFLALQSEVTAAYRRAGALGTLLLAPREPGGLWIDASVFMSREAAERAEAMLEEEGAIEPLFQNFLRITELRQDQIRQEVFEVALCTGIFDPAVPSPVTK